MAKTDEPVAQLATRIPKELHRRLKLHCVTHEIAVQDFVTQAIKRLEKTRAGILAQRRRPMASPLLGGQAASGGSPASVERLTLCFFDN